MSEPFVGEIRMFAGNFAPRGWALCDGQMLAVSQNDALFSLFGTTYGGDGRTTFGLPDLRGRIPIHAGSGPGLTTRKLGAKGGTEKHTIKPENMPSHNHALRASKSYGTESAPAGAVPSGSKMLRFSSKAPTGTLDERSVTNTGTGGTSQANNWMPFLCIHFIVALAGAYPSRQ